jgi:hypothetical protein
MRNKELSLFINAWCKRNRVVLDMASWDLLLRVDLSNGAIRCLRNLLEKARILAEEKHSIYKIEERNKPIVFISEEEIEGAMSENGVSLMRASTGGTKPAADAACTAAVWVSHGCTDSHTYHEMTTGAGKSAPYFRKRLARFRQHFNSSEDAWFYLSEPGALEALGTAGLRGYLGLLDVSEGTVDIGRVFVNGSESHWLEDRGRALIRELKNRATRERFTERLDKFVGLVNGSAAQNHVRP